MVAGLNVVTLGVADLARSREFYENGLGLKAASASTEHIVFFQLGGIVLALYPFDKLAEDALQDLGKETGFRGVTLARNVASKAEVAELLRQAKLAGATIIKPAQDVFWGGHSGYFADPDGHLWEVAWNPYFALNEQGELVLD